ncbi:ABC transporter ATP-binding protein [Oligoflexus sp.]|uniref:ABC transporter ATP-binding protein n=1 Tax=Oligoflexus sp. TaxID=1971216 RepID=UPI0039C9C444
MDTVEGPSVQTTSVNNPGLKRLLQLALPERGRLGLGLIFLILGSGMLLIYPQAVKVIIDEALGSGQRSAIDRAALMMLVVFCVQAVAGGIRYYLFTTAGEKIVARLREQVYKAIMEQDIAFFDTRRTGELMSRLSSDATVLQNAVSVNISLSMRNLGAAVGGLVLLVYTSPVLAFGLFACVPPIAIGTALFGRKIRKISRDVQDALAETGTIAEETISGVRTVRAFAKESTEVQRYAGAVQKSYGLARKRIRSISVITIIAGLLGYAAIAGVLWYGGRLVVDGEMTVGDLTSFILYAMTVAVSVGTLGSLWTDFMSASGAARRVFDILDRTPTIPLRGGDTLPRVEGLVAFERVHFSYPSRPDVVVLQDLDLVIRPGEVVALVGPSGSGKSTIASLICRFYDPTQGRVCLDARDIRELDGDWLRQQIGVVSQDPVLLSASIAANIRYGKAEATDAEVEAAARAAHAHEFIQGFPQGYETIVGERGIQLSGGQRQRVAIARAMLKDPRVLILDEATSALDAESEHLVQEALDVLMTSRTTVVIAHRLSTVRNADRVLVIQSGRIVQSGDHQQLMNDRDGMYFKLVNRQFVVN